MLALLVSMSDLTVLVALTTQPAQHAWLAMATRLALHAPLGILEAIVPHAIQVITLILVEFAVLAEM